MNKQSTNQATNQSSKQLNKKNIEDIVALTPLQEGMLFHYLQNPGSPLYLEQLSLDISGPMDKGFFEAAWQEVARRNGALRTLFRWDKMEKPVQIVLKPSTKESAGSTVGSGGPKIRYVSFSPIGEDSERAGDKWVENIKAADREERFDLTASPFRVTLCEVTENRHQMIISNHHILLDGWSTGILLKEFFGTYAALVEGRHTQGQAKQPFKEFVKWIRTQDPAAAETFWRNYLEGLEQPTELRVKRGNRGQDGVRTSHAVTLERDLTAGLEALARTLTITTASLLYGAWGLLLQRYGNSGDVVLGTTVSGRSAKVRGIEEMVGLFINTLPLRVNCGRDERVSTVLASVEKALRRREEFETSSLADIGDWSPLDGGESLFDTLVVLENYPLEDMLKKRMGTLTLESYDMVEMPHYDLTLGIRVGDCIAIDYIYDAAALERDTLGALAGHFRCMLENILANPEQGVGEIEILSTGEKQRLLVDFNADFNADFNVGFNLGLDVGVDAGVDVAANLQAAGPGGQRAYVNNKTLCGLFEEQVEKRPDGIALIGEWCDGPGGAQRDAVFLTYRQLRDNSEQLRRFLVGEGIGKGDKVGLLAGRTIEMIVGMLGILAAGCAYVPLNPKAPASRSRYMLEECGVDVLVTVPELEDLAGKIAGNGRVVLLGAEGHEGETPHLSLKEGCFTEPLSPWDDAGDADALAYVIFTSGSTGKPKGVPICHGNLSPLLHWGYGHLGLHHGHRVAQNLSYYFDWSAWEIFITLTSGSGLVMVSEEILLNPEGQADFMETYDINVLHATPTQYGYLANLGRRQKSLEYLFLGAEKLTLDLVRRSMDTVPADCRIFNMYGPTEATIIAAVLEIDRENLESYGGLSSVPIGKPAGNTALLVLDWEKRLCPVNVEGELYIAGDGLARGYLNNPELTCEKFISLPTSFTSSPSSPSSLPSPPSPILYNTGDRARWLADGTVEFLGRRDHQVKIRGYRIETGEIENELLAHESVKEAVVTVREDGKGDKYLCAYIVTGEAVTVPALRDYLSEQLPAYMVPSFFLFLEGIPLNPNGKVDLKALPDPAADAVTAEYTAPRDDGERTLTAIFASVLGLDAEGIGIDDHFFHLGGHSLKATQLAAKIHKQLGVAIPLSEILENPTVRSLAARAAALGAEETGAAKKGIEGIKRAERRTHYPLSQAQKRIYLLHLGAEHGTGYNLPAALELEGAVEIGKLERIFAGLIERHESFRTSFIMMDGEPVQVIRDAVPFKIDRDRLPLEDGSGAGSTEDLADRDTWVSRWTAKWITDGIRPFSLDSAPLLRVAVLEMEKERHLMLVDMHHIIADGVSVARISEEFMALYNGQSLPPLAIGYSDYALWQWGPEGADVVAKEEAFWLEQLSGELVPLNLPTDFPRPVRRSFAGNQVPFTVNKEVVRSLKTFCRDENITLYSVILGMLNILLAKLSGSEDIVIGTPVAGRGIAELEGVVGMFVNTLALRNFPKGDRPLRNFIKEAAARSASAFDHQDYPFEQLVEKLGVGGNTGRNPIFDVMFSWQNMDIPQIRVPGLTMTPYPYERSGSKFDITFIGEEVGEELLFTVEYSTDLFNEETLERWFGYFRRLLGVFGPEGDLWRPIAGLEMVDEAEKYDLLVRFNGQEEVFAAHKRLEELVAEQVERVPEGIALVGNWDSATGMDGESVVGAPVAEETFTYRQLWQKACRLAAYLEEKGVRPGDAVGLLTERKVEKIIGMLGILEVGAAYVPLNPTAPASRSCFMLEECGVDYLLTIPSLAALAGEITGKGTAKGEQGNMAIIYLTPHAESLNPLAALPGYSFHFHEPVHESAASCLSPHISPSIQKAKKPHHHAYVIFTSGSTGQPKGVAICHANLSPLLHWGYRHLDLQPRHRVAQNLSYYFDWSAWEIFITLTSGSSLYMITEDVLINPEALADFIIEKSINVLHATPTQYSYLANLGRRLESLEYLCLGAEKLTLDLVRRSIESIGEKCRLFNMYGPTEATIISAVLEIMPPAALRGPYAGSARGRLPLDPR